MNMPADRQGKVALVTGAAQGLGLAYATRLATEGAIVIAADIQPSSSVAEVLKKAGAPDAMYEQVDVSDEDHVARLADAISSRFGHCDIIVNNAGISPRAALRILPSPTGEEPWRSMLRVSFSYAARSRRACENVAMVAL
jgi:NAD(P)-dependent dehydrogenase (short-subunit alcohol dehydrogenase family)